MSFSLSLSCFAKHDAPFILFSVEAFRIMFVILVFKQGKKKNVVFITITCKHLGFLSLKVEC